MEAGRQAEPKPLEISELTAAALIAGTGLRKRFGALTVLDGVDLALRPGEIVGVVGPNGAGKTTLLNVLAGALKPDAGTIVFGGSDVTRTDAAERCKLGIARTHQVPRPFGGMTVFENVLVGATAGRRVRASDTYESCLAILDQCGLIGIANRRADSLGLLDRKRLELARALAVAPKVLLLDEIGGGLTDAEATGLVVTVRGLSAKGIAILWIEHIVHLLMQAVGRLVCMDGGRVIAEGEPGVVVSHAAVIDAYLGSRA